MDPVDECDLIADPQVFWPMAEYALRVHSCLMELRHLYEPKEALKWLTSPQSLLSDRVPGEMLVTLTGMREVSALIARINDGAFS